MIRALPRERYVELYGPEWDAPTPAVPAVVNTEAVLALTEPIPLLWDGVEYSVAPVGFLDGVRLARFLDRMRAAETAPPESPEEAEQMEKELEEALERMWNLIRPCPALNPFADATPLEVGHLIPFFLIAQRLQGASGQSRLAVRSPSTISTPSTSSPTTTRP